MKFKKALLININEQSLGKDYWKRIDKLVEKKVFLPKDSPKISENLKDTDCLLVGFGVSVVKEDIDKAPNLKYIGVLATAFGKIDVVYAKKKWIVVCNLPGYSTESVIEFVFAVILENIRDLEKGRRRGRVLDVSFEGLEAKEIKGKVFAILGLGNMGKRAAEVAQGFGADVRYWSPHRKKDYEKRGVKYEELDRLIADADFLSVHLAQTPDTENILNRKRLMSLKKGAVIVNTTPMELVNLDGLVERLTKKDIVFILDHSDEMDPKDLRRLSKFSNCIIYPPMAFISPEAAVNKQEMFTSNLENFAKGKPQNAVG